MQRLQLGLFPSHLMCRERHARQASEERVVFFWMLLLVMVLRVYCRKTFEAAIRGGCREFDAGIISLSQSLSLIHYSAPFQDRKPRTMDISRMDISRASQHTKRIFIF